MRDLQGRCVGNANSPLAEDEKLCHLSAYTGSQMPLSCVEFYEGIKHSHGYAGPSNEVNG